MNLDIGSREDSLPIEIQRQVADKDDSTLVFQVWKWLKRENKETTCCCHFPRSLSLLSYFDAFGRQLNFRCLEIS